MAQQLFTNNASATLASSIASGALSLTVNTGQGALFPSPTGGDWFTLTLQGSTAREIVKVTARSSDSMTIVRAQEGTSASSFAAGDAAKGLLTAAGLNSFVQEGEAAGGDLTGTYKNPTIASDAVTDAKLRNSAALSVIGRSANSSGDPADIAAGSDGDVLRRSGTTVGFGTLAAASIGSGQLALARGGTNADLSATGGAKQVLKQVSSGAAITVGTITELDVGASTNDAGNTSTAITVDWSVARTQKVTATGSATVTHSNMVAGIVYTLEYYTGAGSFTATFASTNFAGGVAPTLTVTASKVDIFTFYKTIGGTIFGGVFGQVFAP